MEGNEKYEEMKRDDNVQRKGAEEKVNKGNGWKWKVARGRRKR